MIEIVVLLICIAGIIIAYNYYKPTGITSIPFKESIDLINCDKNYNFTSISTPAGSSRFIKESIVFFDGL